MGKSWEIMYKWVTTWAFPMSQYISLYLSISQYISMDRFAGLLVAITSSKLAELVKNHLGRSGWQWETSTW
jgi:hypothetical protein